MLHTWAGTLKNKKKYGSQEVFWKRKPTGKSILLQNFSWFPSKNVINSLSDKECHFYFTAILFFKSYVSRFKKYYYQIKIARKTPLLSISGFHDMLWCVEFNHPIFVNVLKNLLFLGRFPLIHFEETLEGFTKTKGMYSILIHKLN